MVDHQGWSRFTMISISYRCWLTIVALAAAVVAQSSRHSSSRRWWCARCPSSRWFSWTEVAPPSALFSVLLARFSTLDILWVLPLPAWRLDAAGPTLTTSAKLRYMNNTTMFGLIMINHYFISNHCWWTIVTLSFVNRRYQWTINRASHCCQAAALLQIAIRFQVHHGVAQAALELQRRSDVLRATTWMLLWRVGSISIQLMAIVNG